MPKQKGFQLLGAKKRRLAKEKSDGVSEEQIAYHYRTDERLSAMGLVSVESDLLKIYHLVTLY